jgi:hypothetical protein
MVGTIVNGYPEFLDGLIPNSPWVHTLDLMYDPGEFPLLIQVMLEVP